MCICTEQKLRAQVLAARQKQEAALVESVLKVLKTPTKFVVNWHALSDLVKHMNAWASSGPTEQELIEARFCADQFFESNRHIFPTNFLTEIFSYAVFCGAEKVLIIRRRDRCPLSDL